MEELLKSLLSKEIQQNIEKGNVKIINIGLRKEKDYEEDVL